ncbi:penicillin acylase family protein [Bacillus sp. EB106-08-02-XG196]|uniref:penicillin acylase family protein n=1 Tax=Bacillus sp. EB106-08-02-XG196 TaxID=2737049 RepID=UPI0015C47556|nr:penicillin acylase family protein [Bacillus sp. EB106-08-02-XG196]NWQ39535.1 penicillin acylase family protein [Bacillus sp. EB106-08-02-XG196]
MKRNHFLSVLSTTFIAASLLAVPAPGLAKPKSPPQASAVVQIESTKLLMHQGQEVKIVRDSFGVPHVYSETDTALFFGAGYATAEDRLWQAELSRIVASGRMAEVFGGSANIGQDQVIRRDGYTDVEALAQFERLPNYVKRGLQGYIDGINHYIETTPAAALPPEFRGQKPTKWTIVDSLKVQQLMVRRFGESGGGELGKANQLIKLQSKFGLEQGLKAFETINLKNDPSAPVSLHTTTDKGVKKASKLDTTNFPNSEAVAKQLEQEQQMKLDIEKAFGFPHKGGSNAWVVSPSRSASGGTLLLGGPQMGYSAPQISHEVGIHGAGYNSVGMAFAGAGPIPLIGRGNDYAWTTTTGMGDQIDTFVLKINPANSEQYWHKGKWVNFEVRTETIKVAGGTAIDYPIYRSIYGPVVHKDTQTAYTQKRAHWGQEIEAMIGFYDFNKASNIKQFEEAAKNIPTSHNFLYSDKQGNIGYWITGQNALRAEGTDNRLPMLGDGSQDWQGIAPFESNTQAINPAQGYVANWNNKPSAEWEYTESLFGPTHRVGFILDQLDSLKKVSWSDMEEINKRAGHIELNAYFFKDLLLSKINSNQTLPEGIQKAADLVADWDMYQWDENGDELYDDPGLTIFRSWFNRVKASILKELQGIGGDSNDLLYHVLNTDEEGIQSNYSFLGDLDVNQIVLDSLQFAVDNPSAANAGKNLDEWLTPISKINFQQLGAKGVAPIPNMNRGTYNQIIEFSKFNTNSVNIMPPGQSGNPFSPHFDDQRLLYASWEYKPMVLDILKPNKK